MRRISFGGGGVRGRTAAGVVLAGIVVVAALAYGWALTRDPLEPYYAAAVRSMATSWHAFAFGAFDPDATVTLDKLPGAFWIQALLARGFGVQTWTLVVPQVIEGVLAVLVLYRCVRRTAGRAAGLVAALVLAVSPAVVAMDRGNIADPLMILLVLLAADAVVGAVLLGGRWRLVLAGVWVGLAFQAKMIEAWLVLPALALAFLVAGPGGIGRRVRQVLVGGVVAGVVSVLWMAVVSLVPAGARPWVDGSTGNSLFEQVFVYNGLGRVGEATPLQVLTGQGLALPLTSPVPGWDRLLTGPFGRDGGWLLPAAAVIAVVGIVAARHRERTDPVRAGYLLWGMWLVTFFAAFSVAAQINSYYTAALIPAVAALLGIGVSDVRRHRAAFTPRVVAAVVVAGSALYAALLLRGAPAPAWLLPAAALVAALAVVVLLLSKARPRLVGPGAVAALAAVLVVPTVGSALLVLRGGGAFDTPFESRAAAVGVYELFVATPAAVAKTLPTLERARAGAPDLLAVQSAAVASVFSYPSGQEVLPIGGFTGTGPSPTLSALQAAIAAGRFHLVLAFPSTDPRMVWIAAHCRTLPSATPPFRDYYCEPADARG